MQGYLREGGGLREVGGDRGYVLLNTNNLITLFFILFVYELNKQCLSNSKFEAQRMSFGELNIWGL